MSTTAEVWGNSPASILNLSTYLPEPTQTLVQVDSRGNTATSHTSDYSPMSNEEATSRADSIIDVVELSGKEFGRSSSERRMYLESLGESYGQVDFLQRAKTLQELITAANAANISINSQPDEIKQAIAEDINNLNLLGEKLWGEVDPQRLEAMIARIKLKATTILNDQAAPSSQKEAALRLLTNLPSVNNEMAQQFNYAPSSDLLSFYAPLVRKKYSDFLELVSDKDTIDKNELKKIFEECIHVMTERWGLGYAKNWQVSFGRSNINVDPDARTVWIPVTAGDVSRLKAEKLVVHEIGGHLLRYILGHETGDGFMANRLRGGAADEESLLVCLESTLDGRTREAGIPYYLGVGLGQDKLKTGHTASHSEIGNILIDFNIVWEGLPSEKSITLGQKQAHRITRGMPAVIIDDNLHQSMYAFDIKYAQNQKNAVEWMEKNKHNPTALDEVMSGKFAYSNERQSQYASSLYAKKILGQFAIPTAT